MTRRPRPEPQDGVGVNRMRARNTSVIALRKAREMHQLPIIRNIGHDADYAVGRRLHKHQRHVERVNRRRLNIQRRDVRRLRGRAPVYPHQ